MSEVARLLVNLTLLRKREQKKAVKGLSLGKLILQIDSTWNWIQDHLIQRLQRKPFDPQGRQTEVTLNLIQSK